MAVREHNKILENRCVAEGVYLMRVGNMPPARAGQFFMLRPSGTDAPFLGRPISVFDCAEGEVSFLYQIAGRGTALFSTLPPGYALSAEGPYGNGFPLIAGDAVLIGGGIGIAPLHALAKALRKAWPARRIHAYLGFRESAYMHEEFLAVCDEVSLNLGGFVTADVDFSLPVTYYACGPEPMLRAAQTAANNAGAHLYVSLEKHMACGVGACLGCTCKTTGGNRRVCKDGPVFLAEEVLFHA